MAKTQLSAAAVAQAEPLVERYFLAAGITEQDDGDSPDEGGPSIHLLRPSEETEILKEIRAVDFEVRLAILAAMVEAAERHPSVIGRLDDVTHAVVGLDPALRSHVIATIVRPRCKESTPTNEHWAAVRVGIFLQVDDEIPGFALMAVRTLLDTPEALRAEGTYASERRLTVYADRISSDDPLEDCRVWIALTRDKRLDPTVGRRIVARMDERLAEADPSEISSDDYEGLWIWLLEKGRDNRLGVDPSTVAERERRCLALIETALKENPEVAFRDLSGELWRVIVYLKKYPELFALIPEAAVRQAALKEKDAFLALVRPDLAKPDGEKRATGPLVILRLQLADEYLTQDERREMAAAMVERVKTCEQSELSRVFLQLSSARLPLTGDECIAVLEALEPSPFGDSEKNEPAINQGSYRAVVASFPIEELDGVARWLFERIRGERPATHYYEALVEAAAGCEPETATTIMTYYCENVSVAVTSRHWPAVATIAKLVPEAAATPLAEQMIAAAEQQSDAQTSLAHMRLAGALANADAKLRYRAFEYVLAKTEYRPEFMGDDTGPKGSLLRGHCAPTIAAIIAAFSPEDKQWAFEKLMATLTGNHASSEALVLVRGLVTMAADLSSEDAERAFEVLVRLNAAEDRRQPETPLLLRQFLEARAPEGRPRLLKLLLPSIIDGRFRQSSSDPQSSFATALMVSSADGLTSTEARETLNVMYDLLQAQEASASVYLFRPFLDRIAAEERDSFAQDILDRMQRSTVASHIVVFEDGVARLGHGATAGTGEAPASRRPVSSVSRQPSTTVKPNVSLDDLADNNNRVRNLPSYLDAQGLLPIEERLAVVRRLDEKGYLTRATGYSLDYIVLDWIIRDVYLDPPETVVGLLAEPDCVGFEQRLLTAVLTARHEERDRWSELWELADVFGTAP